ncbi:TPA: hypothetical protein ACX6S1_003812 [Photobacterium damselae]
MNNDLILKALLAKKNEHIKPIETKVENNSKEINVLVTESAVTKIKSEKKENKEKKETKAKGKGSYVTSRRSDKLTKFIEENDLERQAFCINTIQDFFKSYKENEKLNFIKKIKETRKKEKEESKKEKVSHFNIYYSLTEKEKEIQESIIETAFRYSIKIKLTEFYKIILEEGIENYEQI